jgi:hypothetical protein
MKNEKKKKRYDIYDGATRVAYFLADSFQEALSKGAKIARDLRMKNLKVKEHKEKDD